MKKLSCVKIPKIDRLWFDYDPLKNHNTEPNIAYSSKSVAETFVAVTIDIGGINLILSTREHEVIIFLYPCYC